MKRLPVASVVIVVILVACLAPTSVGEIDALDDQDYRISIPGNPGSSGINKATIGNGNSASFFIYIENYTNHVLDASFYVMSFDDHIMGSAPTNITIPAVHDEEPGLVTQEFIISVAESMPSQDGASLILNIMLTDLVDDSYAIVAIHFEINVISNFDIPGAYNKFFGLVENNLPAPFNSPVVPFIVSMFGFALLGLAAGYILYRICFRNEEGSDDDRRRRLKALIFPSSAAVAVLVFLDIGLEIMGSDHDLIYVVFKVDKILATIIVAAALWKVYIAVVHTSLLRIGKNDEEVDALMPVFSVIGMMTICSFATLGILHILGFDVSGALIGTGFVALCITIGATQVLTQLFSGVSIILTRRYREGDYISVDDHMYIVRKVRLLYTEMTSTKRDRIYIVPNDKAASMVVANSEKEFDTYRAYVYFQLPYGCDLEKVEEILIDFANGIEVTSKDPIKAPALKLLEFQDSGILMRLDVTVPFNVSEKKIRKALYIYMGENGIQAPYNRIDVKIQSEETSYSKIDEGRKTGGCANEQRFF